MKTYWVPTYWTMSFWSSDYWPHHMEAVDCPPIMRNGFPERFIGELLSKYSGGYTGRWADFNIMYNAYRKFKDLAYYSKLICRVHIPDYPRPSDFEDLEANRTLDGPPIDYTSPG